MSQTCSMYSPSPMMTSFTNCASLSAVLSAFDNLKARYNAIKKENKRLKEKIVRYEETCNGGEKENKALLHTSKDPVRQVATPRPNISSPEFNDVLPTVQSIVSNISDQLIIIGHQLDSLLIDFDRIETKDEIYKVHDTFKSVILPRLVEIRRKEIESMFYSDQQSSSLYSLKADDEDMVSKSTQDEAITENLLKLQRLLRKQNMMLRNLTCFISEGGGEHALSGLPLDGWSFLNKT